jgi:hypothetical protein
VLFEPFPATFYDIDMDGLVNIIEQAIDIAHHRHIGDQPVIITGADIGGIAALGLKPPDEFGRDFGQGINLIELVQEVGKTRSLQRKYQACDVDLGEIYIAYSVDTAWHTENSISSHIG